MLRAAAALLVVAFHTEWIVTAHTSKPPFFGVFLNGFRGVDLFFVLSGFMIAYVHGADIGCPWRVSNYALKRASRIYPAVWIMTVFAYTVYALGFGGADKADKLSTFNVLQSLFLLPQTGDAVLNVTWTLKYEVFFYLLFGIMIFDRYVGLVLLLIWQIAVVIGTIYLPSHTIGISGFYIRSLCLEFGVGMACAWVINRPLFVLWSQGVLLQWLLLAIGVLAFTVGMAADSYTSFAGIFCALGAGNIILGLVRLEQSGRLRIPKFIMLLGGASYSIYLVNYSVITLSVSLLARTKTLPMNGVMSLCVLVLTVAVGLAFDRVIDQPVQRFLRRKLKPAPLAIRPLGSH
jgi:peptidoglycan/LPS O-acetylase OafA/YrhL